MRKTRRVAIAIDLSYPYRHHYDDFAGIQRYAQEKGDWEWVVNPFVQLARNKRGVPNYDGMIARASSEMAKQAAKARVPIVNIWAGSPAKMLPSVMPDFRACARLAATHLLERGHRHFAFQGFWGHRGSRDALAGFSEVLSGANCTCTTQFIKTQFNETASGLENYRLKVERWITTWKLPIGVLVHQDNIGRHLVNACLQNGLRVPEDVALIGLGDEPLICARPEPSLSSIDIGHERVGYEAAALLDRLMAGEPPPDKPILVEPGELIARRSTDCYASEIPQVRQALQFIAAHSHEGIRVDDVAGHVQATVRSLERHFRAAIGRTMAEEIGRLRLERAKRRLIESPEPIKQVATQNGYGDANYFQQVFRKAYGISPGEYRRRSRK